MLFHEYFHGEDGRGVGASHQTGWTALVARCLESLAKGRFGAGAGSVSATGLPVDEVTEWLEADGLGGFASGLVRGANPRAYSTPNSSECGLRWHARLRKIHGPA